MSEIQELNLMTIAASEINPRRRIDQGAMDELVQSIQQHGVLQPIIVRPWVAPDAGTPAAALGIGVEGRTRAKGRTPPAFEIVCGERRWQAAKRAGLKTIPSIVRTLTAEEAAVIQIIENVQRDNLDPMDEADAYVELVNKYHYAPEALAEKIGHSRSFVYGRLKLAELCPAGRALVREGKIIHSVGLLIARIGSEARQKEAIELVQNADRYGESISYRQAQRLIHEQFMLRLSEAPFDVKDATLPGGPCAVCPKRTGNQPDLFGDVQNKDTCTDPDCFKAKAEAWTARELDKARAKGQTVLPKEESGKVFTQYGSLKSEWIDLDRTCLDLPQGSKAKTWGQLIGKKRVAPTVTVDEENKLRRLMPRDEALEALEEAGIKLPKSNNFDAAAERRAKNRKKFTALAMTAAPYMIQSAVSGSTIKEECCSPLARALFEIAPRDARVFVAKRRGLAKTALDADPALEDWLKAEKDPESLLGFVIELLLCGRWYEGFEYKPRKAWKDACRLLGVPAVYYSGGKGEEELRDE